MDQLDFFLGKQENSNREGFPAYVADRLTAVKWRNWKVHFILQDNMYDPPLRLPMPRVYNLLADLKEQHDVGVYKTWVAEPVMKIVADFQASLKKYPPITVGTPDLMFRRNNKLVVRSRISKLRPANFGGTVANRPSI